MRRRDVVMGSLAVGAACLSGVKARAQVGPLHCVPPLPPGQPNEFMPATTGPVRVRKSVFELDASEIARLKAAYGALRNLYRDDPRSWSNQGLVHCWYCSGAMDGLNGQEIHGGWWFLPWHRAYLNFHEQILAHLVGDASFALPYWDWDTGGRDRFPDAYRDPNNSSNPLFDPTRKVGPTDRIPDFFVGTKVMQSIMSLNTFSDFGGSSDQGKVDQQGEDDQMGALEGAPHGGVHLWVTDPAQFSGAPNMGSLGTAAFDPVFFAHHANIDRLWDVWVGNNHANPDIKRWLTGQPFYFYDQTQSWTSITIDQLLDPETSLRYRYQAPSTPSGVATAAPPSPRTAPRVAQLKPLSAPIIELSQTQETKALSPDPTTIQVAVPAPARTRLRELAAPASTNRLVLRIDGVEVPTDRGAVVNVFLNRPDATAATGANDAGFVGSMVVVPSIARGAGHTHRTVYRNFAFDVTQQLAAALAANGNIAVTLVPMAGAGKKPTEVSLGYRRVYIATR